MVADVDGKNVRDGNAQARQGRGRHDDCEVATVAGELATNCLLVRCVALTLCLELPLSHHALQRFYNCACNQSVSIWLFRCCKSLRYSSCTICRASPSKRKRERSFLLLVASGGGAFRSPEQTPSKNDPTIEHDDDDANVFQCGHSHPLPTFPLLQLPLN